MAADTVHKCACSVGLSNMAACGLRALSAVKGLHLVLSQWLLRNQSQAACTCLSLQAARCRLFHISRVASLCSFRTESERNREDQHGTDHGRARQLAPEYIPQRKAKNPMIPIGFAWLIGLPSGIIGFFLMKKQVDKNRLKQLKVRQKTRQANEGEYEESRAHRHAETVKLDQ
ncbi:DUF4748 domain-containing protein [Thalassophryne amazonica]|uniref:DUF4748 domain-containing protein n=1 Tax=Thalassophryne amazonica TaxID=390379 RepID=UPI0014717466|nr:DUF4748 domain-containing protein [Thalassophryne amazonica]